MISDRLDYRRVSPADLEAFHQLIIDDHVRRYLLNGDLYGREWSEERIRDSQALFDRCGVGIWLAQLKGSTELVGFCGLLEIPSVHPEPQLIYAIFERFTGKGYATEMARAAIDHARIEAGFCEIVAGVDEVNAASVRVLEKLGFERVSVTQGAFGNMFLLRLTALA